MERYALNISGYVWLALCGLLFPTVLYLGKRLAEKLLNKFGIKELTKEEVKQITAEEFPTWYKHLYLGFLILFCGVFVGLAFLAGFSLWSLQEKLYSSQEIIFFKSNSLGLFFILSLFVSIFISYFLVTLLALPFPKFCRYVVYFETSRGWRHLKSFKKELIWSSWASIIILLIAMPFYILGLDYYVKIDKNYIIINPYFSFKERVYPWNSIRQIDLSAYRTLSSLHSYNFRYNVFFNDGASIDLWGKDFWKAYPEIHSILTSNNIPINVSKLAEQDIKYIEKYYHKEILNLFIKN